MNDNSVSTVLQQADSLHKLGKYAESEQILRTALFAPQHTITEEEAIRLHLSLATSLRRRSLTTQAFESARVALQISHDIGNSELLGRANSSLGLLYLDTSEYALSLEHSQISFEIHQKLNNKHAMAINLGNMGSAYNAVSDYQHALDSYFSALSIYEELENQSGIALNLGNIGLVYQNLSKPSLALEYFHKALELDRNLNNPYGCARHLGNIGSLHLDNEEYSLSLQFLSEAREIFGEIGDIASVALCCGISGLAHLKLQDYNAALALFHEALEISKDLHNDAETARQIANIGRVYMMPDSKHYNPVQAEKELLNALEICRACMLKKEQFEIHQLLSDVYRKNENWKEFAYHFEQYHLLEKEVLSEEIQKEAQQRAYERKIAEHEKRVAAEQASTQARIEEQQRLLHNVLPPSIAERLLANETFIAESYPAVSILFMDIVNFTLVAARIPPKALIYVLNSIFSVADRIIQQFGLEKIKTIGDAYMAVCGAPVPNQFHALNTAYAALELRTAISQLTIEIPHELSNNEWLELIREIHIRIGIHCGEAIGGVIGDKKFSFDLWGDTVNIAARMESHGEIGKIHVTEFFLQELLSSGVEFNVIPRGGIFIKGKGMMSTYFLEHRVLKESSYR